MAAWARLADCVAALQVHMLQQLLDVGLADAAGVAEDSADSSAGAARDVTRARIIAQQKVSHTAWYPATAWYRTPHGIPQLQATGAKWNWIDGETVTRPT